MAEKPKFRRGQGPNALPQGAAAALNRAQPNFALENQDIPVEFATPQDDIVPDEAFDDDDDLGVLLADPDPRFSPTPKDRAGRIPRYVVRHLPQLQAAQRDPNAHPTLRAYYLSIVRNLEREQMNRG